MAKASVEKVPKVSKKKSQDVKADAPHKMRETKPVDEEPVPPVDPSSSKLKKEAKKKAKEPVKEAEEPEAAVAAGKKEKKRKGQVKADAVEDKVVEADAGAKVGKKGKRKAAEVEDKGAEVAKDTKKKRKSTAVEGFEKAPPAPKTKKLKSAPVVEEPPSSPAKPTPKEAKKEKTKRVKVAEPEPETEENDAEDNEAEEEGVYGFESDDDDSSDEEVDDIPGIDLGRLPTIAKDDATVKRKLEKAKRKPTEDRGVLYLGRIPHGFYEDQMKTYFSQFGNVTRVRLSRNKKTGKPKHYAFVEFDSSSVARIVADTMDNYLLMGHILTCKVIPKDQIHSELWVGANRKWRPVPRDRVARVAHNKPRTEDVLEKAEVRLLKRQEQRKRKIEETGIKYDFEAVAYKKKPKPTEA